MKFLQNLEGWRLPTYEMTGIKLHCHYVGRGTLLPNVALRGRLLCGQTWLEGFPTNSNKTQTLCVSSENFDAYV